MAWSTSKLAELAGTTLRTVRHYHDVGLLEEPERRANGYKSYGVAHLVQVMRIKRLSELGFSLSQIAEMDEAEEYPEQALRTLDAELADTIERLERMRTDLTVVLHGSSPTELMPELPPEMALAAADADLNEADRSLAVVMTRVFAPEAQAAYTEALQNVARGPDDEAFDALPADADEEMRRELVDRLLPTARAMLADHPELRDPEALAPEGPRRTAQTLTTAMDDLYNPAQRDVLRRIGRALAKDPGPVRVP
ncbi:MerR family transcriptional regulator [Nocardiopsis sediminis]|uniref:MerR family transcriptional regulator n=1 Tax=Nocardiopsis sediminis TaxID=1778267 RepID=A0ABV8FQ40_9ACTN